VEACEDSPGHSGHFRNQERRQTTGVAAGAAKPWEGDRCQTS
jgi:hypothetical protein